MALAVLAARAGSLHGAGELASRVKLGLQGSLRVSYLRVGRSVDGHPA
jgi:hypothetical protein